MQSCVRWLQLRQQILAEKVDKLMTKIKILISLWQVLKGMGFSFSIPYPTILDNAINSVGGLIEIELPQILPLGCAMPLNYFHKILIRTIVPLMLYAVLLLTSRFFRKRGQKHKSELLVDTVFFIIFLVFPSTVSQRAEPLTPGFRNGASRLFPGRRPPLSSPPLCVCRSRTDPQ